MSTKFVLKSSNSDATLTFSDRESDYFLVSFNRAAVNALVRVYAHTDTLGVLHFFEELSRTPVPHTKPIEWQSIEGEFKVTGHCDKLGHVELEIEFYCLSGQPEQWHFTGGLVTDLGLLNGYVNEARAFFTD